MLVTLSPLFPMAVSGIASKQTAGTQSHAVRGVSSHLEVCAPEAWAGVGAGAWCGTGGLICLFFKITLFRDFIAFIP